MRSDLQKRGAAFLHEAFDGRGETHRLPHISPPIFRIHLRSADRCASYGGDHWKSCFAANDSSKLFPQAFFDRTHLRAVERVIRGEEAVEECLALERGGDLFERLHITGKRDLARGVDRGERNATGETLFPL